MRSDLRMPPTDLLEVVMRPKHMYLALCILGTVLPYSQLLPFLAEHGLDSRAFIQQMFATPVGGFFSWDVLVSSAVLWVLVLVEGRREGTRHWWAPLAANLAVGVSLGLPLFLYLRETRAKGPTSPGDHRGDGDGAPRS